MLLFKQIRGQNSQGYSSPLSPGGRKGGLQWASEVPGYGLQSPESSSLYKPCSRVRLTAKQTDPGASSHPHCSTISRKTPGNLHFSHYVSLFSSKLTWEAPNYQGGVIQIFPEFGSLKNYRHHPII